MGKPFSGKAKKEQLKAKRDRKREVADSDDIGEAQRRRRQESHAARKLAASSAPHQQKGKAAAAAGGGRRMNPTLWESEARQTVADAAARRLAAAEPLAPAAERRSPVPSEPLDATPLPIFARPEWTYEMNAAELESREQSLFSEWMSGLLSKYRGQLNFFESNIETWRQLWRVVERSDVVLHLVDARHALFHYSAALHAYVRSIGKPLVVVMNKCDLVDEATASAWEAHLRTVCAVDDVVRFSASRKFVESSADEDAEDEVASGVRPREQHSRSMPTSFSKRYAAAAEFRDRLLATVRRIAHERYGEGLERLPSNKAHESIGAGDTLTIVVGTVGNPNVGKSSTINALVQRKVVSVSRTPGHTKHFQTVRLADDVVLCDCPGMVFPALDRPRNLQVVCGLYPLSQLRDPFSTVRYVAERFPLERVYGLKLDEDSDQWSPWSIAESFAVKRGYRTGRSGRPDAHRAAREILQDVIDGRIALYWGPPNAAGAEISKREREAETQRLERALRSVAKDTAPKEGDGEEASDDENAGNEEEEVEDEEEEEEEEEDDDDDESKEKHKNPFDLLDDDD